MGALLANHIEGVFSSFRTTRYYMKFDIYISYVFAEVRIPVSRG